MGPHAWVAPMSPVAARLRSKYSPTVTEANGHTDDTPKGRLETVRASPDGPPAEGGHPDAVPDGRGVVEQLSLPAPNALRCDYCGGLTTRPRRSGRDTVACSGRCRTNAWRWQRFEAVPRPPWSGSSLWGRCARKSVDDRPRTERRTVAGTGQSVGSVAELRNALARLASDVQFALRDGPVTLVWYAEREVVIRPQVER